MVHELCGVDIASLKLRRAATGGLGAVSQNPWSGSPVGGIVSRILYFRGYSGVYGMYALSAYREPALIVLLSPPTYIQMHATRTPKKRRKTGKREKEGRKKEENERSDRPPSGSSRSAGYRSQGESASLRSSMHTSWAGSKRNSASAVDDPSEINDGETAVTCSCRVRDGCIEGIVRRVTGQARHGLVLHRQLSNPINHQTLCESVDRQPVERWGCRALRLQCLTKMLRNDV